MIIINVLTKTVNYRLAYQTIHAQTGVPSAQFRSLLLHFIGDQDHEKVFDIGRKVETRFKRDQC